ncbi:hypothetical protein HYT45_00505 [Candidatus Uhrbacteria bacterium]|nr:hypothetical protein [Candidatus Uhrbacteria bacterium]
MDRLEELKKWFNDAPLGQKFPLRLDGLSPGFAEVSMEIEMNDLVTAGPMMIVQGGVLAVLADAAAVMAAMSTLSDGHTPLAHISYDLISPTTLLDFRLIAVAKARGQNARWIWVDVNIYGMNPNPSREDNLKAVVSAKFAKPKAK